MTEQFSVPDTDVFVFPEFIRAIYTDEATGKHLPYRLYVPENYDKTKQCPIFFFPHGAGERGSDNDTHIQFFAKSFQVAGDLLSGAIILAPQKSGDRITPYHSASYGAGNSVFTVSAYLIRNRTFKT